MKNKKVVWIIIGVIAVALVALAITYAYWQITKNQTGENLVSSACLDISITSESDAINLESQFPISDEEGAALTPYTFTVTNNCDIEISYRISLESLGTELTSISANAIKVKMDDDNPYLLGSRSNIEPTLTDAFASHKLKSGRLAAKDENGASATHALRLWIDYDAPNTEMNKTFESKISITVGQGIEVAGLGEKILASYGGESKIVEGTYNKVTTYSAEVSSTTTTITEFATVSGENWSDDGNTFLGNTYTYSDIRFLNGYTFDESTNTIKASGDEIIVNGENCIDGSVDCSVYPYLITTDYNTEDMSDVIYEIESISSDTSNPYIKAKKINVVQKTTYNSPTVDGLYKATDDYGDSYYFRGNVTNNYVKFGTYPEDSKVTTTIGYTGCLYEEDGEVCGGEYTYDTEAECEADMVGRGEYQCKPITESAAGKDMYWRIVRINGDGTIRLIFNGTSATPIAADTIINSLSVIEDLDNFTSSVFSASNYWYETNLKNDYSTYLADGIFCTETSSVAEADEYGDYYYLPVYDRIRNNAPTLKCVDSNGKYTVANGKLTNPVGLITADEVLMGDSYLYSYLPTYEDEYSERYHTMNVIYYGVGSSNFYEVTKSGLSSQSYYGSGIRPVINIKADILFSGTGTTSDPYVLEG